MSMIQVIARLFAPAIAGQIDALAGQVADLSKESVRQLVCDKVQEMSLSEARGYVRARAASIVRKQARIAMSCQDGGTGQDWIEMVAPAATERIVPWVLRHACVGAPRAVAPTTTVRLAA